MPESIHELDFDDEIYCGTKNLRLNRSKKSLRRLRAFERIHYKKTCEVKKTGHGLADEHCLNDGDLRYGTRNLTYSLNKKKRWLLPEILEQRICEHDLQSNLKKDKREFNIDERLKIVMYENVNSSYPSTCIRYGNSQTIPHIIHKNGSRFNSESLTKWMDFNTRERWTHRNRKQREDRINQPNFGFERRAGFFPSEVTYEFLYPQRPRPGQTHQHGKTSLAYASKLEHSDWIGRHYKDTTKHRRKVRRYECANFDREYDFDEEEVEDSEYILPSSDSMDENQRWSIVFDEFDEPIPSSVSFLIDYFIPSPSTVNCPRHSDEQLSDIVVDRKANKHFEPPPLPESNTSKPKPVPTTEHLLCTLSCENESSFVSAMQQSNKKLSQANLSPAIFLQRNSTSSFSVLYTFDPASSSIKATLKYIDPPIHISVDQTTITINQLIELISEKLDEDASTIKMTSVQTSRIDVDHLRGSLPVSPSISRYMILVKPNATDKQKALEDENLIDHISNEIEQWFHPTKNQYEMFECSICCEVLTSDDVYQLLPCHHSLCQACLASYIRTSVATATYSSTSTSLITCFQSNCPTELNPALVQAFVSYDIYRSYRQTLIERRLFSSGRYRQCPSRACSKLLIVSDNGKSSLMCSCGQRVCSTCLEEYHFPATCKQYKAYEARLRKSSDHLLSASKIEDHSHCYIAEGKNCPSCGEFVEKNGGCPHMTCKCGNEYCWTCLKRWAAHNSANCVTIPESTHELRSSTRSRYFNKALHHRRQRNQREFELLTNSISRLKYFAHYGLILSTYIDLNTLAEFLYVLMQRRRINGNIRAVLGQTASRLEVDAFRIRLQLDCGQFKKEYFDQIRANLDRTLASLLHMKKTKVLL